MVHPVQQKEDGSKAEEQPFPWHLGVFDAHCHPTDTLEGLRDVSQMKARILTIMSTREQDQDLVSRAYSDKSLDLAALNSELDKKASPCQLLPAFGWHPWFSHQMIDDLHGGQAISKSNHYKSVLTPQPDEEFIIGLEEPQSLSAFLTRTRKYLERHPHAIIGEVGLDRSMRIPVNTTEGRAVEPEPDVTPGGRANRRLSPHKIDIKHQQKILLAQLRLAGELERAVSVHGVAAHGFLYDTISSTWKGHERNVISKREQQMMHPDDVKELQDIKPGPKPYPPRICLHSYSGPPDTIRQYLHPSTPAKIFFSFSQVVNFAHGSNKPYEAIRAVPDDRILIESDLHRAGQTMDELLENVARTICEVKEWDLEHGVRVLAANWKHFALGIE